MVNEPPAKLRIMLETNVVFAGVIWPRFPYEVLRHAVQGDYQLVLPEYVLYETRKTIKKFGSRATKRLEDFLTASQYELAADPSNEELQTNERLVRDVKDVPIALAAINAKVDYLLSQDRDLTDPTEPIHQKLKILLPAAFLRQHMGWSSDDLEAIRHRTWDDLSDEE